MPWHGAAVARALPAGTPRRRGACRQPGQRDRGRQYGGQRQQSGQRRRRQLRGGELGGEQRARSGGHAGLQRIAQPFTAAQQQAARRPTGGCCG